MRERLRALRRALLPHEVAFVLLLLAVWPWLAAVQGVLGRDSLIWLALLAADLLVLALTVPRPTIQRWRVRLSWSLLLMNAVYFELGPVIRALRGGREDALLQRVDTFLFGAPLPLLIDRWSHALFSDVLSACYMVLFPYIFLSCARQVVRASRDLVTAQRFFTGLFLAYAIGFAGYLAVPAQGAWLDIPGAFHTVIRGGWLTRLNARIVLQGSNRVDVFPSLHVAASAFMLFFDRIHAPWRYRAYLLPAIGLWISTIYLRYHYGIDVIAGFALAAVALAVAERVTPRAVVSVLPTPEPAPAPTPAPTP